MNARIFIPTIVALVFSGFAQAQLLEPRPDQNGPEPVSTDPSFGLISTEREETVSEEVLLRGQITEFDFVQPETIISLEANRDNWQLIAPSAVELRRLGWNSDSLFIGEMVEILAEREPGNGNFARLKRITRANGALLLTGLEQDEPANSASDFANIPEGYYVLDPRQAHLFFSFNHLGFSSTPVKVERLSGNVNWNQTSPDSSTIQLDMDVSSLRSGVTLLDEALRGQDFFDFLNYPRIRFNSTQISLSKWGGLSIDGTLEIMDISQPVSLTGEIIHTGPNPLTQKFTVGVSAQGELNRSDWEMTDYLPIIEDRIRISFEGEFILSTNPGNQNGNPSSQGLSPGRPSPFENLPNQPGAIEALPESGNSDVSTNPAQDNGFIFNE